MKRVDRHNPRKLYLQLVEVLKETIENGDLPIGSQLPTENVICNEQGISKAVVRAAMQELVKQGYIIKIPGKGTFVKKNKESNTINLSLKLTEQFLDFGVAWDTEVIQKMQSVPPTDLKNFFALEKDNQVFKVSRIRKIKGIPIIQETAYVSHDLCPGFTLEDLRISSIFDLFTKKYQIPITRCADSIEMTTLEAREATLLQKKENDSALLLDRIIYTTNDRIVAFIRAICVSEEHRITFESIRL